MISTNSEFPENYVPNSIFEMKVKNCLIDLKKKGSKEINLPENIVKLESDGKISKDYLPDDLKEKVLRIGNVYVYSGTNETLEEVIKWVKSHKTIPREGDIIVVNSDNFLRGTYLVGNTELKSKDDLVELVVPVHKEGCTEKSFSVCNPLLSSHDSTCCWEVFHNLNKRHVFVQVIDNFAGHIIYPAVMLKDDNSLRVTLRSNEDIPAEMYTILVKA